MWEGIFGGVISFLICKFLSFICKKSKSKIKLFFYKLKVHLKGKYTMEEMICIENMPEEKRTKRQQRAYDEFRKKWEKHLPQISKAIEKFNTNMPKFLN